MQLEKKFNGNSEAERLCLIIVTVRTRCVEVAYKGNDIRVDS